MRCRRAQRWMVAAVDGELSPRRRRMLEGHAASCSECRRELVATGAVLQRVAGLAASSDQSSNKPPLSLQELRVIRRYRS